MPHTVLVFAPHPDDAEYYAGGTLAGWIASGSRVILVTVTDGSKGSFAHPSEQLTAMRHAEAEAAAKTLGAESTIFLGYPDFELDTLPVGQIRRDFIRLLRQYKPDILVAQDAFAQGEIHPDHCVVARAAVEAANFSKLPGLYPELGLEPYVVPEKYYYSEDPARWNKIVDISATFERKIAAMAAHKSQIEFMVAELLEQARQAGINVEETMGGFVQDPLAAFQMGMGSMNAEMGAKAGYDLGEGFYYERYHPLVEAMLPQG
ncbi:MAG TPA: PIG-L family deacetylase [Longilinea sp.]|nr:PIG-L family deacetylase [Longilinea sp.]